ncbi:MAG: M28 family peptidase [Fusicatenibacter sp.]
MTLSEKENKKTELFHHLQKLCKGEKLSGSTDAREGVRYLCSFLQQNGIPFETYTFSAYLSNPLESHFLVFDEHSEKADTKREIKSRPRSFSMNCPQMVRGELLFDPFSCSSSHLMEEQEFLKSVRGKLILAFGYDEKYAKLLEQYGAAGWIQIWTSDEDEIHEDTVGTIWGTPDLESVWSTLHLPVAAISGPDGKRLIARLQNGEKLTAGLQVTVDTHVQEVILPVAEIKGTSDDFVLLSGHYDTWYEGAMDNGSSNSIMLELASEFYRMNRQTPLARSLRIAWWPGHSNGRYMGSTWYADYFHQDLSANCIAHINSDLTGSVTSDILTVRTTGLEGSAFYQELCDRLHVDPPAIFGKIGRGADQSFWGERIPYHIALRRERLPERKESAAPGSGDWWWHTRYDTIDKVDPEAMFLEYRYLYGLLRAFLMYPELPADPDFYFDLMDQELSEIEQSGTESTREIRELLAAIHIQMEALLRQNRLKKEILKETAGRIHQLRQSYGAAHAQDLAFSWGTFPLLRAGAQKRENCPKDWYLFAETTFIRQKNRCIDTLTEINKTLKYTLEELQ